MDEVIQPAIRGFTPLSECSNYQARYSRPTSIASYHDLTANLSPALRAARVNALCPSEAAVRADNTEGGRHPCL